MVIVQLLGGLGNQMFQYALGRHLAIKNSSELKLDISQFRSYRLHAFCLQHFETVKTLASEEEIRLLKYGYNSLPLAIIFEGINKITKRIAGKTCLKKRSYIEEEKFSFSPDILQLSGDLFFQGYWQSEKYFREIRDVLLHDFLVTEAPDEANNTMLQKIKSCQSVALHVRRGDYVSNNETSKTHGCCSVQYYEAAVSMILQKVKDPRFFIFSDEPDWAESNLKFGNSTIVRGNGAAKNFEDLRLMNNCQHNIIANSSFSWWGAWLNQNPNKIVIAPKTWFNSGNQDTSDLIPESWERI